MKKNKISKNWVNKQRRDTYVKQSKIDGYRARSAYKLKEIDEKFKVFKGDISIPHSRMHLRNFVLIPLYELNKNWFHPALNISIKNLIFSLSIKDIRSIKKV